MFIRVHHGSLTDGNESLLVNAANTQVRLGSGVSHAIRLGCGDGFQEHIVDAMLTKFGRTMSPAEVFITHAGSHPRAKHVAHVAVMDYRDVGEEVFPDHDRITTCCKNLWAVVDELQAPVTIAMVALGGGTGGLGVEMPTTIACETLRAHLDAGGGTQIGGLTFYGWTEDEFRTMSTTVSRFWPQATIDAPT